MTLADFDPQLRQTGNLDLKFFVINVLYARFSTLRGLAALPLLANDEWN
jgi:hypothetical protein